MMDINALHASHVSSTRPAPKLRNVRRRVREMPSWFACVER